MIPYSLYSGWHKHTRHRVMPTIVRFMQRAARSSFISITFFQMTTWTNRIKVTVLANKIIIIKHPKYILKSQTFTIVKLVYLLKKKRLIKGESVAKSKPDAKYKVAIVEIFSPYKYRSIKLRARWQCFRRIYDFSLIYKRVIKLALYDFKMLYPY